MTPRDEGPTRRATLSLTWRCNNRCVFCAQSGHAALAGDADVDLNDLTARLVSLRAESDELTFIGGEPTLYPRLLEAVRAARAAGFVRVGVQTNGAGLGEAAVASALVDSGLTDVHLSIHATQAAAHDYHTGNTGSFERVAAALVHARGAGLVVAATTVITRSSYRVVNELPRWLRERGVAAWCLSWPRVSGAATDAFDRIVPRLGLAIPFALHAAETARRLGLPAFLEGAPACTLGPYARALITGVPAGYGHTCDGCAARTSCDGMDPVYAARFGEQELTRLTAVAATVEPHAHLRRLFVGVGHQENKSRPRTSPRALEIVD